MIPFLLFCLAVCALLLLAWAIAAGVEARCVRVGAETSAARRRCSRLQIAALAALGVTGAILLAGGAREGQRWIVMVGISAPFWAVLMWASLQLNKQFR